MLEQSEQAAQFTDIENSENTYKKAILSIDNLGIFASTLCLVHCLAMPFLIALLPFIGLQFLDSHESHMWLGGFIISFALAAIVPGYLKHKKIAVLMGMLTGIGLVLSGSFFAHALNIHDNELWIMITGNLMLVATHLFNKRLLSTSSCCDNH